MKTVLIIPSWYMDSQSPSAGTFFKEQALLIKNDFQLVMFFQERFFCSAEELEHFEYNIRVDSSQEIPTYIGVFPQSKQISADKNYYAQVKALSACLQKINNDGFSIDIIHAQATFPAGVLALYLHERFSIPFFITEHFGPFNVDFLHSQLWKTKMINALEKANVVYCVSKFLRQQLLMQNVKCDPIVIGNFVDDRLFTINDKYNKTEIIRILHIAYYPGYIKDESTLFKALAIVRDKGYDMQLTFVGGGEPKGGFVSNNPFSLLVKEYGFERQAIIYGGASRGKISELMKNCDMYVSSSISETFGISMCEAMLSGKPVVITENGGSSEYATPQNSVVVEIHNPEALANAIIDVHKNYSSFSPYFMRKTIVEKYGHENFRKLLVNSYNKALEK